jgi:hypothetical protein
MCAAKVSQLAMKQSFNRYNAHAKQTARCGLNRFYMSHVLSVGVGLQQLVRKAISLQINFT